LHKIRTQLEIEVIFSTSYQLFNKYARYLFFGKSINSFQLLLVA